MFNLDKAIDGWRRGLEASPSLSADDVEELERHIRDQIRDRIARGSTEQEAFGAALTEVGPYGTMEGEFKKVFWQKAYARRSLREQVKWRVSATMYDLRLAARNAKRFGISTSLNVVGLSLGIGACLLICLFTLQEFRFDRHHAGFDRIYRVVLEREGAETTVSTPVPLAAELRAAIPSIEQAATFGPLWDGVMRSGEAQFHESNVFVGEPQILDILDFEFLRGSPQTALDSPESLVLTRASAQRYFQSINVLGERFEFTYEGSQEYVVTGVIEDLPVESHFQFDFLVSLASQPGFMESDAGAWEWEFNPTYVLLLEAATEADLGAALTSVASAHPAAGLRALRPQPLSSVHLHSHHAGEIGQNGDITRLLILAALAVLILLIAVINFINMSAALAVARSREVGVRKVMGAGRGSLVRQFLGEALLTALLATAAGTLLATLAMPLFNRLAGVNLQLGLESVGSLLAAAALIGVAAGLLAGTYPALALSAYGPTFAIRRASSVARRGLSRKALVAAQFGLTVFFLICIGVMHQQLVFVQSQDTGMASDQIVYMRSPQRQTPTPYAAFKRELEAIPGVEAVAGTGDVPGSGDTPFRVQVGLAGTAAETRVPMAIYFVHPDFFDVFDVSWTVGGLPHTPADSVRYLAFNEAGARALLIDRVMLPDVEGFVRANTDPTFAARLSGVVEDFQFASLHRAIEPVLLVVAPRTHTWTYLAARVNGSDFGTTIRDMETAWARVAPEWPLEVEILNQRFRAMYEREENLRAVFGLFAALAILIACLGLFGLAVFSTQERTKEIGVRKVLGATVPGIVLLLSREFLTPVALGFVVAVPAAWIVTARWLSDFAFRIEMPIGVYATAGFVAMLIAFLTVAGRTVGTARQNPAGSLRYE